MDSLVATPLELEILTRLYSLHGAKGFPRVADIRVTGREHTGVGRFTDLESDALVEVPDGTLGIGVYSHLQMEGVPNGMVMLVFVENKHLTLLELATSGNETWDGVERPWRIWDEAKA
jgi:hypothetical protein